MTDRSTGFWAAVVVCGIVALPVLYLFLLGPALYLFEIDAITNESWNNLSYPLAYCGDRFGEFPAWFWNIHGAYLSWWQALGGPPIRAMIYSSGSP